MPGCGSGAFASSSDLLFDSHPGHLQAETPLNALSKFAEPPLIGRFIVAVSSITACCGSQYVSIKCSEHFAEARIEPSVGSVGDSYDNALAETINGLYKAEVIHRRGPWRSFEAVEFATLEWVDWFNYRRLLEPIGNIPPPEAEQRYYAILDDIPMAA